VWTLILLPLASVLCVVGFIDDRRGLSARLRLVVQILAATGLLFQLNHPLPFAPWLYPLALIWLVWTMNAYNFMDGSNGMAGMQGVFSGVMLALVLLLNDAPVLALAAASLAAVCAGFLPWNAPIAKIFMGDSGSVPLGFLLAGLSLAALAEGKLNIPILLMLLLPFHIDAGLTLLSRICNKERWYTPHNNHVYQKLLNRGWTHGRVLQLYAAINALLVAPAVILGTLYPEGSWVVFGVITGALVTAWYSVLLKLRERT
jgi:Fuc2NAc and GlcNAc transferase